MLAHRESLGHVRLNSVQHNEHLVNPISNEKMTAGRRVSPIEYIVLMGSYLPS